jgi:hypothetical protein
MVLNHPHGTHREAAMVMDKLGEYAGEYVARCAVGRCGYFGELPEMSISLVIIKIEMV